MADSTESEVSTEIIVQYRCRKCQGQLFTAAEKKAHKIFHRRQKKVLKTAPLVMRPSSSPRSVKPAKEEDSEATLFQPVPKRKAPEATKQRCSPRKKAKQETIQSLPVKIESKKHYDFDRKWEKGVGA